MYNIINDPYFRKISGLLSLTIALISTTSSLADPLKDSNAESVSTTPINLKPTVQASPSFSYGYKNLSKKSGRKLTQEENALLHIQDKGKWKTFSDDIISFDLPDSHLLKVETVTNPNKTKIPKIGSAVKTAIAPVSRVYKITFSNGLPYGAILISKATWFDKSICFCGAVTRISYDETKGNLQEFSYLKNGQIKKIQTINDHQRAVLFEWTHSAITQRAYTRIGSSMHLKKASTNTLTDWIKVSQEKGFEAALGWLKAGISQDKVINYLGRPKVKNSKNLTYEQSDRWDTGGGYLTRHQFTFKNNRLTQLQPQWCSSEKLAPTRGSRDWLRNTIRNWEDSYDEDEDPTPPKLPKNDVALILGIFHQKAPSASSDDWNWLCGLIADLKRLGVSDAKAAKFIKQRFSEGDYSQFQARWVLELYNLPGKELLIRQRIDFLLSDSKAATPYLGELNNLIASLDREVPEDVESLRHAVKHSNVKIQAQAIYFADKLPKDEARIIVTQALKNKNPDIRHKAYLLVDDIFLKKDIPWLNKIHSQETNKHEASYLKKQITNIQETE